jgi:hypothetical protein
MNFLGIKNYNLPIPRPPYRKSKLQKKTSALKREHPALQNMKFLNFFLNFVGNFCPPRSGSGYGSTDLIESGSKNTKTIQRSNGSTNLGFDEVRYLEFLGDRLLLGQRQGLLLLFLLEFLRSLHVKKVSFIIMYSTFRILLYKSSVSTNTDIFMQATESGSVNKMYDISDKMCGQTLTGPVLAPNPGRQNIWTSNSDQLFRTIVLSHPMF